MSWYLSSRSEVPGAGRIPDVVLHAVGYAALTISLVGALLSTGSTGTTGPAGQVTLGSALTASLMFAILYGAIDEAHQSLVPGRDPSIKDLLVDSCASLIVVAGAAAASTKLRTNKP